MYRARHPGTSLQGGRHYSLSSAEFQAASGEAVGLATMRAVSTSPAQEPKPAPPSRKVHPLSATSCVNGEDVPYWSGLRGADALAPPSSGRSSPDRFHSLAEDSGPTPPMTRLPMAQGAANSQRARRTICRCEGSTSASISAPATASAISSLW